MYVNVDDLNGIIKLYVWDLYGDNLNQQYDFLIFFGVYKL